MLAGTATVRRMQWDDRLDAFFDDLEQQAEGLHLAERDAELVDRSRAEYAQVALVGRLYASIGARVQLHVCGVGTLTGSLTRVGLGWLMVRPAAPARDWILRTESLRRVRGLSTRAVSEEARPVVARLGFGAVLRGVAEAAAPVVVHHLDGAQTRARVLRVGADFAEVEASEEAGPLVTDVLPFAAIAAVRDG